MFTKCNMSLYSSLEKGLNLLKQSLSPSFSISLSFCVLICLSLHLSLFLGYFISCCELILYMRCAWNDALWFCNEMNSLGDFQQCTVDWQLAIWKNWQFSLGPKAQRCCEIALVAEENGHGKLKLLDTNKMVQLVGF